MSWQSRVVRGMASAMFLLWALPAVASAATAAELLATMETKATALKARAEAARAAVAKLPPGPAKGPVALACCANDLRAMRDIVQSMGARALHDLYRQANHTQGIAIGGRLNICMHELTGSVNAFAQATDTHAAMTALEGILTRLDTRTFRNIAEARGCCAAVTQPPSRR